ncbi:hypothetical protein [Aggregatibacter actinomycetemcomitans]|uniref:hypothetical protein n=1 Tax=Aggregatibacter actinomycetemcomitans TaxID=714 RepID=UPI001F11E8C7|nr:hypothetical protein [Aggregatibacter actinomycetemcomitans]
MALRLIFCLIFMIFPYSAYAKLSIANNIYVSGKIFNSVLHPDIVGSTLSINSDYLIISNSYNASSYIKTEVNYFFDIFTEKLKRIEQIEYSSEYDRYYGYTINFENGREISRIDDDYINSLERKFGFKNYYFNKEKEKILLVVDALNNKLYLNTYDGRDPVFINYENLSNGSIDSKYSVCKFKDLIGSTIDCKQIGFVNVKTFLYSEPDSKFRTNMYLIRGDQVVLLKEKIDIDNKWYLIRYKGKKEIDMWLKADSVDLN